MSLVIRCMQGMTRSPHVASRSGEGDPARAIMTDVSAAVTVTPLTSPAHAVARAAAKGVEHLLVVDDDRLLGVVRTADLGRGQSINAVTDATPWAVPSTASLGELAGVIRETGATLVLIVDGVEVVGLVTGSDLRRAGVACGDAKFACLADS